tara:strand:+ start:547 stop:1179 length:633 start_codon:yes stop_codon:yes gene_type:complete
MGRAKEIILKVIPTEFANNFVKKHHYSGKFCMNSQLHFGCFLDKKLGGVMSYGCPIDKRKVIGIVKGTKWNEFLELNRMAFSDLLPKYSESRCIAISMKLLKKNAPHIKWVLSFADGTQCGDGTIYRASGFKLIGIKKNTKIYKLQSGETIAKHGTSKRDFTNSERLEGYQLKYIYFIDKTKEKNLTVPVMPFSKIKEMGAGMYKGKMRV